MIRCTLASIPVKVAEDFYVGKLGFRKIQDAPLGEHRWLTVQAQDGSGAEIALEPASFDFAQAYQTTLYERGIPINSLACDDVQAEYERLTGLGVTFRSGPERVEGMPMMAIFEDGCGNLVSLHQA